MKLIGKELEISAIGARPRPGFEMLYLLEIKINL